MNKQLLLSHVGEIDIFLFYLGLNEVPRGNISSPFTEDRNPSFKLYPNNRFMCFSSGRCGDAFQFVADLYNLDCKSQFTEVLKRIEADMGISDGLPTKEQNYPNWKSKESNREKKKPFHLRVETSPWTKENRVFWDRLGIPHEVLEKYRVQPVTRYGFFSERKGKQLDFNIDKDVFCFAYEVNNRFEVYLPSQPAKGVKKRFLNGLHSSDVFGMNQLIEMGYQCDIIICAGKKDALMSISRGIPAVSFASETILPKEEHINILRSMCDRLWVCYDNDKGGWTGTKKIRSKHPCIRALPLPLEYNDITDFIVENTHKELIKLIKNE